MFAIQLPTGGVLVRRFVTITIQKRIGFVCQESLIYNLQVRKLYGQDCVKEVPLIRKGLPVAFPKATLLTIY